MTADERFVQESERVLRIELDGGAWLKPGAAIAYRGRITFERLPTLQASSATEAVLREMAPLVRAVGHGRLYCGHHGAHLRILRLEDEALDVVWQDLVAFEESLQFESRIVAHGIGFIAGGVTTVRVSGRGAVVIGSHGEPLRLQVSPGDPLCTDPHATIAWSATLTPELKTDISWRSLFHHGGQEPVQMCFDGAGEVIVQPFEDPRRVSLERGALKQLSSLLGG